MKTEGPRDVAFISEDEMAKLSAEERKVLVMNMQVTHLAITSTIMSALIDKVDEELPNLLYSDERPTEAQILEAVKSLAYQNIFDGSTRSSIAALRGAGYTANSASEVVYENTKKNMEELLLVIGRALGVNPMNIIEAAKNGPVGWDMQFKREGKDE